MRIVRSVITSVVEGAVKLFSGSGLVGETFTEREFFQQFGFTSIPPAGSEGIVFVIGNRVFMLASDNRDKRPAIADGETCIYTDKNNWIKIQADKTIQVNSENNVEVTAKNITGTASVQAAVTAPVVNIVSATSIALQAPLVNNGPAGFLSLLTSAFIAFFNAHTHGGGAIPDQQASAGAHATVNTLAS